MFDREPPFSHHPDVPLTSEPDPSPDWAASAQADDAYTDDFPAEPARAVRHRSQLVDDFTEPAFSTWDVAAHGPTPRPGWVITDGEAIDEDLGVLKTGKEADVSLIRRYIPGGAEIVMAAKRYRPAERRLFHRDAGYTEGRRVRRSRETRAMARRTEFGRELLGGQWAGAEFAALSTLWSLDVAVPYPVQLIGTELLLEFIGTPDGQAAPRLAQCRPTPSEARDLYDQCRAAMTALAAAGWAHGDLSAYNLLVHAGRLVVIDLPQVVDIAANPRGPEFLQRDCVNIGRWFSSRGVDVNVDELFGDLIAEAVARW